MQLHLQLFVQSWKHKFLEWIRSNVKRPTTKPEAHCAVTLVHITTVPVSLAVLIKDQIAYMKERGLDVHGISSPGELADQFVQRYRIPFHAVPMTREITPFRDIIALFRLWRLLRQLRPHIVHAHTPKGGLLGTMAAWLAGVPVRIYQIRGLRYMTVSGSKRALLILSEGLACRLANHVLCNSHSIAQVAEADKLCPPEKIKVLLNGSGNGVNAKTRFNPACLPNDVRHQTRAQYGIPAEALVIGYIGRIVRDKGMVELSAAWKVLRDEFPNLHWLVIGPFESEDPVPEDVRDLLQSDSRIHLAGYVDNSLMPTIYPAMDVLAFPSYREGFPISPLESAAMQIPVVATRIPGCVDAVVDGVTGTLVPSHDSEALTNALRYYLQNPELRLQHGTAGRNRVLDQFQPERIWEALYQEYMNLLAAKQITF